MTTKTHDAIASLLAIALMDREKVHFDIDVKVNIENEVLKVSLECEPYEFSLPDLSCILGSDGIHHQKRITLKELMDTGASINKILERENSK